MVGSGAGAVAVSVDVLLSLITLFAVFVVTLSEVKGSAAGGAGAELGSSAGGGSFGSDVGKGAAGLAGLVAGAGY